MKAQYWITVTGYGTVFVTDDELKAEEKFSLWCKVVEDGPGETKTVVLFEKARGGYGRIWKRNDELV